MRPRPSGSGRGAMLLVLALSLALGACSSAGMSTLPAPSASPAVSAEAASAGPGASRPSSPATIRIVSPTMNQAVTGATVHVVVAVENAHVVQATTTAVRPNEGHVHLYLDNTLVYMNYTLEQDLPVHPGTYVLKAEFVASDHVPFSPRVWSSEVLFTVK